MPTLERLITAAIVPVLFSGLSRVQDDDEKFNNLYFNTQRIDAVFVFPMGIGIYLYSDMATKIMLGSQWTEAGKIIGVWALSNAIMIVCGHFCSEVYRAKGRPKLSFIAQLLHLIVLVPVCIISSKYGFWTLVNARTWIRLEFILVHLVIMKFAIGFPISKTFINVMPIAIAAIAMGVLGYFLQQGSNSLLWSFVSIIICALFYFGALYLFPDIRKDLRKLRN